MSRPKPKPFINEDGQGQRNALFGQFSVMVAANNEDAHNLAALFLKEFNMKSCIHYDDIFISMCYSEAGSSSEILRVKIVAFIRGYFCAKSRGRIMEVIQNSDTTALRF